MKSNRLLTCFILIFGFLIMLPEAAFGQKDSVKRDTIKEEYNKESDFYMKRREKYDYLTRAKIEELSMFKGGVLFAPSGIIQFVGISIGYEKKLSPDFSLNVNAAYNIPDFLSFPAVNVSLAGIS